MQREITREMRQCIQHCLDCYKLCLETAVYCLTEGPDAGAESSKEGGSGPIGTLMECAQICRTSAEFMLMGSGFHERTCQVCAEICEVGAAECDRLADPVLKLCAVMCRRCAQSCGRMAEHKAKAA